MLSLAIIDAREFDTSNIVMFGLAKETNRTRLKLVNSFRKCSGPRYGHGIWI